MTQTQDQTRNQTRKQTQMSVRPVTFPRVLTSEWIKVTSLRSTWILMLSTVLVMIGLAALLAFGIVESLGTENEIPPELVRTVATSGGGGFAQLIIASFGAVFVAGEYGTGMIRSTMTAVPNRWSPLVAKAIVLGIISFLVGVVSSLIAFFVAQPILGTKDLDFSISTEGVLGSILGLGLYLAIVSLLGMSIGALLRSSPGAIVTTIGILFVLPIVISLIPLDLFADLYPYLPDQAGYQLTMIDTSADELNQWQGGLVAFAWALAAHIAALILVRVRDV